MTEFFSSLYLLDQIGFVLTGFYSFLGLGYGVYLFATAGRVR